MNFEEVVYIFNVLETTAINFRSYLNINAFIQFYLCSFYNSGHNNTWLES